MKNNYKKSIILLLIINVLFLSFMIASAKEDISPSTDSIIEEEEFEKPLITPNLNIKKEGEIGEGGEEKIKPFIEMENSKKDTENENRGSLTILGNQAIKDGSNGFTNKPIFFILVIASLLAIIMVCIVKKK